MQIHWKYRLLAKILRLRNTLLGRMGGKIVGVRGILINAQNEVLLLRHTYRPGWYLPGGGVDRNETAAMAVIREVHEETGLSATGQPELFHVYLNRWLGIDDHVLVFAIRQYQGKAEIHDPFEIAELGWFALSDLPEEVNPATARCLAQFLGQAERSDYWQR